MDRNSGRKLKDNKIYEYEGKVQKFDYSIQKLGDEFITVYYNLLEGPIVSQFRYKSTIGINNSSEFTVESKSSFIISPEDRFFLQDGSYGKVINNRLINQKGYNRRRRRIKNTEFEQIISAG